MSAGEICNREVVIVKKDASILEVARLMCEHHVGDIIVVEPCGESNIPVGILTDRDLVIEVLARDIPIASVSAADVMCSELITARESDDNLETLRRMRNHGIRRIPVVNESGALQGIITLDDLLNLFAEQMEDMVRLLAREQQHERKLRDNS